MQDRLLKNIKTKEEADLLKEELELLIELIYESKADLFSLIREKVRASTYDLLNEALRKVENKEAFLRELLVKLDKISVVSLILSFEPSKAAVERFHSFIEEATRKPVILDIGYDPGIIGGVILIYEGKFKDFSFKKIFEKVFEESRKKFIEILQKSSLPQSISS